MHPQLARSTFNKNTLYLRTMYFRPMVISF